MQCTPLLVAVVCLFVFVCGIDPNEGGKTEEQMLDEIRNTEITGGTPYLTSKDANPLGGFVDPVSVLSNIPDSIFSDMPSGYPINDLSHPTHPFNYPLHPLNGPVNPLLFSSPLSSLQTLPSLDFELAQISGIPPEHLLSNPIDLPHPFVDQGVQRFPEDPIRSLEHDIQRLSLTLQTAKHHDATLRNQAKESYFAIKREKKKMKDTVDDFKQTKKKLAEIRVSLQNAYKKKATAILLGQLENAEKVIHDLQKRAGDSDPEFAERVNAKIGSIHEHMLDLKELLEEKRRGTVTKEKVNEDLSKEVAENNAGSEDELVKAEDVESMEDPSVSEELGTTDESQEEETDVSDKLPEKVKENAPLDVQTPIDTSSASPINSTDASF